MLKEEVELEGCTFMPEIHSKLKMPYERPMTKVVQEETFSRFYVPLIKLLFTQYNV